MSVTIWLSRRLGKGHAVPREAVRQVEALHLTVAGPELGKTAFSAVISPR
jgi:hypothetical protein